MHYVQTEWCSKAFPSRRELRKSEQREFDEIFNGYVRRVEQFVQSDIQISVPAFEARLVCNAITQRVKFPLHRPIAGTAVVVNHGELLQRNSQVRELQQTMLRQRRNPTVGIVRAFATRLQQVNDLESVQNALGLSNFILGSLYTPDEFQTLFASEIQGFHRDMGTWESNRDRHAEMARFAATDIRWQIPFLVAACEIYACAIEVKFLKNGENDGDAYFIRFEKMQTTRQFIEVFVMQFNMDNGNWVC
jgi:hypothetical protein